MINVIMLSGKARHGKGTTAELLIEQLPLRTNTGQWKMAAFAGAVKRIACNITGADIDFINHWKNEAAPPPGWQRPVRELLQGIGELGRSVDKDVWAKRMADQLSPNSNHVIEDLRYISEADYVIRAPQAPRILAVRIIRPGYTDQSTRGSGARHTSETDMDAIDDAIMRTGHTVSGPINRERLPRGECLFDYVLYNTAASHDEFKCHVLHQLLPWCEDRLKWLV